MAVRSGKEDVLEDYFGVRLNSERLFSFVWTMICTYDAQFQSKNINIYSKEEIIAFLDSNPNARGNIKNQLQNTLIPDEHLNWIKHETRQSRWIINYIDSRLHHRIHNIHPPIHLSDRNRCIAHFDHWSRLLAGDSSRGISFAEQMQSDWEKHSKPYRHFDWLKKDDSAEKINFFHDWLSSNNKIPAGYKKVFQNYEDFLELSDYEKWSLEAIILLNQRAQATWRQKQQRAKDKNKRQCNFILTNSTIEKLEKLAQNYRSNRTEIIEFLINEEFKNEHHINQRKLHPLSPDAYKTD